MNERKKSNRLFLIGNGFDLTHGMPTSYKDFKVFLQKKYKLAEREEIPDIPYTGMAPDGEETVDSVEAIRVVGWLLSTCAALGSDWNEFELALGLLDYESVMDENTRLCHDPENFGWEYDNYEMIASNLMFSMLQIPQIFEQWIHTIELPKTPKEEIIRLLLGEGNLFLSFNYTETLEALYKIPADCVCHIHGERKSYDELIIGHGNLSERKFKVHLGADDILSAIQDELRKNTEKCWLDHADFFSKIEEENITEIYSYGFSFSEVDMFYVKKICESIDTSGTTWYLNSYQLDAAKKAAIILALKGAGYRGKFGLPYTC